jgi:hypothetical protein
MRLGNDAERCAVPALQTVNPCFTAGVEKLCKDLKVDPSDRGVLLLAWKV